MKSAKKSAMQNAMKYPKANTPIILCSVLILISTLATHTPVYAGDPPTIQFKEAGKLVKKLTLEELGKLVSAEKIKVNELHEKSQMEYQAFRFKSVLDAIYGKRWSKTEEILFTCSDGYQPSVPQAKIEAYPSFLAFGRPDHDFTLTYEKKLIPLGPFYLIWDNIHTEELKWEDMGDWPYQVTTVDLIRFQDHFPNLAPPEKSSAAAKRGFLTYRKNCLTCHTINGEGGNKAPELNYPINILEYYSEKWLKKWISDPTSIRYRTGMPAFNPEAQNRAQKIEDLVAYLRAMGKNKKKPHQ